MKRMTFALLVAVAVLMSSIARAHDDDDDGDWHGGWYGDDHDHGGWDWDGGFAIYPGSFWWGTPYHYYGAGYPYYDYDVTYPAPYYPRAVVVQPPQPQVYIQQPQPVQQYWYYCQDPQGYYPSVQQCRSEWMQVVPRGGSSAPR